MRHGGFKDGWFYFWDAMYGTRLTFVIGFFVGAAVLDIIGDGIVAFVRWLV
jgi:hypothetical protein